MSCDVDKLEPDVNILSLSIISPGRADIFLPMPVVPNSKGVWFTLKEGSSYKLKFTFSVSNNIVSGLRYINTVWKTGVRGKFLVWFLSILSFLCIEELFHNGFIFLQSYVQWTEQRRCLVLLVLSLNLTHTRHQKRPPL